MKRFLDRLLPVGPRSVLFGAHQFVIHPFFVWVAWTRLYGFPWDPRLYAVFFIHDLGYLFRWCRNMDGPEGEQHVIWGAMLAEKLLGPRYRDLCLFHSRFWSKRLGQRYSRLCVADKLAVALEPWWLYLPRVIASGEINEYMAHAQGGKYASAGHSTQSRRAWCASIQQYLRAWCDEHKDLRPDHWTNV